MLPVALAANREVAERALAELARAAGLSGEADDAAAAADSLIGAIDAIGSRIGIPRRLGEVGVRADQIPALVQDSRGNSMDGNPRTIDDAELTRLLEAQL
jgi:alcohol dehydrogenase class IV